MEREEIVKLSNEAMERVKSGKAGTIPPNQSHIAWLKNAEAQREEIDASEVAFFAELSIEKAVEHGIDMWSNVFQSDPRGGPKYVLASLDAAGYQIVKKVPHDLGVLVTGITEENRHPEI